MFFGGAPNNINAQIEVDRLAADARANQAQEVDAAGQRAESMTIAARAVLGSAVVVAIAVGGVWVLYGTAPALIAAGIVGLSAIAFVLRRRTRT